MKVTLLGTGTSHGVPVIGCNCPVCLSSDPKNKRYRTSAYIQDGGVSLIIDMPAEYRLRAIEYGIDFVDAVLLTHAHADHTAGLDEVRRYNEIAGGKIPLYSTEEVNREVKQRFSYIFKDTQEGGGKPKIELINVKPFEKFSVKSTEIMPLAVKHGCLDVLSFRINDFVYMTDVSEIPEKVFEYLKGVKVLVLDALRKEEHPTHFNLNQAIEAAQRIGAEKTYFTHITHRLEHAETEKELPDNIFMGYDGMQITL